MGSFDVSAGRAVADVFCQPRNSSFERPRMEPLAGVAFLGSGCQCASCDPFDFPKRVCVAQQAALIRPENGFSCCVLLALFIASRAFWHPFTIPSGSMKPNLLPGDYLIAMRAIGRPERGEVILFRHPATADIYIKRLVAMSGDSVQMVDGVLHLNGEAMAMSPLPDWVEARGPQGPLGLTPRCTNPSVEETCANGRMLERLPNGRSYAVLGIGEQRYDNTSVTDLPEGYLFVLGDNCDNALHSRIAPVSGGPGLVPEENVVWRPSLRVFSSTDAAGRFLRWVH